MHQCAPGSEGKDLNVVYEVPCHDCQLTYIGETRRSTKKRLTEHRYAVKTGDPKNGIAVHVQKSQHTNDWGAGRIQATVIGYWNRRTMEAIQIHRRIQSMNLDCGLHFSLYGTHLSILLRTPMTMTSSTLLLLIHHTPPHLSFIHTFTLMHFTPSFHANFPHLLPSREARQLISTPKSPNICIYVYMYITMSVMDTSLVASKSYL